MTNPKIAPRVDDDGVGWCDFDCPSLGNNNVCKIDGFIHMGYVCEQWIKRMAVENRALRDLIIWNLHLHHGISRDPDWSGSPSDAEWDDCLTKMHAATEEE